MKLRILLILSLLTASATTYAAAEAAPKPHAPAAKKAAPKAVAPKPAAENKRFGNLLKGKRKAVLELEKIDKRMIDTWLEIIELKTGIARADLIWGVKARRSAEKYKVSADKSLPRLLESYDKRYERLTRKLESLLKRKEKEVAKQEALRPVKNETLTAKRAKALKDLQDQAAQIEDMIGALESIQDSIYGKASSRTKAKDRLAQIGIRRHTGKEFMEAMTTSYNHLIEEVYSIKDIKADIQLLEKRKKEAKNWTSRDEVYLKTANMKLEKEGAKIKQLTAKAQLKLKCDIDKTKRKISQLKNKIDKMPDNSRSKDGYSRKMWDIESELLVKEQINTALTRLADWKKL